MNKAFVREPEPDDKAYCPRCQSLGLPVTAGALDRHISDEARARMTESAWFCNRGQCEVAYFNWFDAVVLVTELKAPVFPKDLDAPLCACFGFTLEDIERDIEEGAPSRVRGLLEKSRSAQAQCATLAADGQCCIGEAQRIYIRRTQA